VRSRALHIGLPKITLCLLCLSRIRSRAATNSKTGKVISSASRVIHGNESSCLSTPYCSSLKDSTIRHCLSSVTIE
jgi:hypothetical protein